MKEVFEYCPNSKLLIIKWIGEFSMDEYMQGLDKFIIETKRIEIKNVIHDIRKLDFNLKPSKIEEIAKVRIKYIENKHNSIYLTSKPQDVVFAILFADMVKGQKTDHCSTIEMAVNLLKLEDNFEAISKAFKKLESRTS